MFTNEMSLVNWFGSSGKYGCGCRCTRPTVLSSNICTICFGSVSNRFNAVRTYVDNAFRSECKCIIPRVFSQYNYGEKKCLSCDGDISDVIEFVSSISKTQLYYAYT